VLDWPPYSRDLNPIEQSERNEAVDPRAHPQLKELGESQAAQDKLTTVIVEAWEAIPQDYINGLIRYMDNRVNAVLDAKGWHTRY
jgi:hypothetical protein